MQGCNDKKSKVMKNIKKQLEASQSMVLGYAQDLIGELLNIEIKAVEGKGDREFLKVLRQYKNTVRTVFGNCKYEFRTGNPLEVTRGVLTDFLAITEWVVFCVKEGLFQRETIDWIKGDYFHGCYLNIEIGKTLAEELIKDMTNMD